MRYAARIGTWALLLWGGLLVSLSAAEDALPEARRLIAEYERDVVPIEIETAQAWWKANVSGKDEDFAAKEAAENRLNEALADRDRFGRIERLRKKKLGDPLVRRQIELLYLIHVEKQVDPRLLRRMTSKSNAIEKQFNVYRARVGGRSYTDSEVRRILRTSTDTQLRRDVWAAGKDVGAAVIDDLKELVFLRNQAARQLGFADYHVMQLALHEQDQQAVLALFDELDRLTREPFRKRKEAIDRRLAQRYGLTVAALRPWHYDDPFFQEPPAIYGADLDAPFAEADILDICRRFYRGIGLPIDDVLERSDLFEKPGKSPHAFCTDIDRTGDVRVLANIVPTEYWMGTMLHELGHAVYSSKFIPRTKPYLLRTEAHILTTEGVAMMFERFSKSGEWLRAMGVPVADVDAYSAAAREMRRDELLIFSRWCQVMLRFEAAMYGNPEQDLNRLWWDLVERYQGLHRPEGRDAPDFAAKIHIVSAPCYYHNYMMGELFACQLHATIAKKVFHRDDSSALVYTKAPQVGRFMIDRVFSQGKQLPWNELTRFATGEPLSAKAFAAEFGGE